MLTAEQQFRAAIALRPQYAAAHYYLALTLIAHPIDKLDWSQAAAECRAALREQPDYPEALKLLGVALTQMNRPVEAVPVLQHALQLRPHYPEAHLSLGLAYQAQLRAADALAQYRQALLDRPSYVEARIHVAKCLLDQNENAAARRELETAIQQNPDLADAHYLLARLELGASESQSAALEFRQVQQLNNRRTLAVHATRLSNAGLDAAKQNDFQNALKNLHAAIETKPDDPLAHYNLGLVLADTGHLDQGIAQVREAISLDPLVPKMHASLLRMLQRAHAPQTDFSPADTPLQHLAMGRQLMGQGDTLDAAGEFLRALTLDPSNFDPRYQLAAAYLQLGKTDESTLEFYKLLALRPNSPEVHSGLELALHQAKPQ